MNPTKTAASAASLPLDSDLAEALLKHKARATYKSDSDYVFASDSGKPRWAGILLTDHIKPAAAKARIGKVGWHTFRHTYSSLLHAFGTVPVVQKELLRHADIRTTLGIYTHGVSEDKRQASSRVAQALL